MGTADVGQHWPAMHVERWPLDRLIPYARNARTHSEGQIALLAASMREWGVTMPVLVDEAGTIIAGHGRVEAARLLADADPNFAQLPVIIARGWSDPQKRAYALADNKLALLAGWDDQMLALELVELRDLSFDLGLIGFSALELNALIGTPGFGPASEDDQGRLDQLKQATCPRCGHEFTP